MKIAIYTNPTTKHTTVFRGGHREAVVTRRSASGVLISTYHLPDARAFWNTFQTKANIISSS